MELDESGLLPDPLLEQNLRRLQEEEKLLLEQQAVMEAGTLDDIAALEHQDALRLNRLQQQELQKQLAVQAQRLALRQAQAQAQTHGHGHGHSHELGHMHGPRREQHARRRATCTVRVNNLHAAEAMETDV